MSVPSERSGVGRAHVQVAAGAVLISFAPVFVKLVSVGPSVAGFYRMVVGAVVLGAVAVVRGERFRSGGALRVYLPTIAAGLLFALDLAFWHRSIRYVGPGLATILGNCQVFLLAGFGVVVLKERGGWRLAAGIALAMVGLFLLFGRQWDALGPRYRLGVIFGALTALSYAAYLLILRGGQGSPARLKPAARLAIICVVSAIGLAALALADGERFAVPDVHTGALLLGYGLVAQVFGWILIARGIPSVRAARAGVLLLLQPALAFVWDVAFFHRPVGAFDLAGAGLALIGIYFGASERG